MVTKSNLIALLLSVVTNLALIAQENPFFPGGGNGQEDIVQWSLEIRKGTSDTFDLEYTGKLKPGWVLYSSYTAEGGSLPAVFEYPDQGVELLGEIREGKTYEKYQEVFGVTETFFKDEARFTQGIRLTDKSPRRFQVFLSYQVCEEELCIPFEQVFEFEVVNQGGEPVIRPAVTGMAGDQGTGGSFTGNAPEYFQLPLKNRELLQGATVAESGSISWDIFLKGLIGGLIAVFTPCVLPLVPLMVNFFSKQEEARTKRGGGLVYAFFIILIYLLLSLPFHLIRGIDPQILNNLATNVWMNLSFFAVFLIFALSFFGLFEIRLPVGWGARADKASDTLKGPLGVFFMALTLVIVSFSCTGPILGLLLGSTALGEGDVAVNLSLGMAGFGLGLALPFTLLSFFPRWLSSLPRSGGWMEFIKITLAFLELALAIKFLSNADLVGNWNLLKREIFIGAWILIVLAYTLYLLGVLRFSANRFAPGSWSWRIPVIALMIFSGTYLCLGLVGESRLSAISGLLPPDFYSLNSTRTECPLGLECYKDFEEGWRASRASGKPMLLDFTGWACANCRQMEQDVWSRPEIYGLIRDDFVLVSLYTDDRTPLPGDQRFQVELRGGLQKSIRTIGQKWGTFQFLNFGAISQPYYVLLSPELELLSPATQTESARDYQSWLKSGLRRYAENR